MIEVVCERFNLRSNLFDLRTHISAEEVDELIDELVPDSVRGRRSGYAEFDLIVGSTSRRSNTYENVDIIRIDAPAQDKCGKTVLVIRPGPGVWLPL